MLYGSLKSFEMRALMAGRYWASKEWSYWMYWSSMGGLLGWAVGGVGSILIWRNYYCVMTELKKWNYSVESRK